ncbi:MAG: 3'-5' exonuclease [Campylobacterales bacterium]|nr:3'-5' exonuclease [Campylobacterales bacterium]
MISLIKNYFNKKRLVDKEFEFLFEPIDDEFVSIDTETTGLNPKKDEIITIGAVKIKDNKILTSQKFECIVKPTKPIGTDSIKIHHIRHCDLENGIDIKDAIYQLLHFIGGRTLIGYYLEFDVELINKYTKEFLNITLPNKQIELSALYFDKKITTIPQANIDLRFDSIMKDLDLPMLGKHDALNDAIMTSLAFIKLQNIKKI